MIRRTDNHGKTPGKRCRGNLRPAPFFLTPATIRGVVELSLRPAPRVVEVPVVHVKLVDRPRGGTGPRANDNKLLPPPGEKIRSGEDGARDAVSGNLPVPEAASHPIPMPETLVALEAAAIVALRQHNAATASAHAILEQAAHDHASPLAGDPLDWPDAPLPEATVIVGIDMASGPDKAVVATFRDGKLVEVAEARDAKNGHDTRSRRALRLPPAPKPERKSDVRYRQAKDRDARELERPVDRLAVIRAAAKAVRDREAARVARLALGRAEARPIALPPLPFARRMEQLQGAIAFLKARCILVWPVDREALIRTYRVSGKRDSMMAEDVIEHARRMGFVA